MPCEAHSAYRWVSVLSCNSVMECVGTPLEKMLLMLNDKVDLLHDRVHELFTHVNSAKNTIPWTQFNHRAVIVYVTGLREPPEDIKEWTRRGWDVWKLTVEGSCQVCYEITDRRYRWVVSVKTSNAQGKGFCGPFERAQLVRELLTA